MLARTRGATDEHRLGGERVLGFRRIVCPFASRQLSGSSFVVSRKRALEMKCWMQIGLEHLSGCCRGRMDTGGWDGLLAINLRRAVWRGSDVKPARRIFRIVKVEESVLVPGGIRFCGRGHGEGGYESPVGCEGETVQRREREERENEFIRKFGDGATNGETVSNRLFGLAQDQSQARIAERILSAQKRITSRRFLDRQKEIYDNGITLEYRQGGVTETAATKK